MCPDFKAVGLRRRSLQLTVGGNQARLDARSEFEISPKGALVLAPAPEPVPASTASAPTTMPTRSIPGILFEMLMARDESMY